jgi:hypothetical protein
MHAHVYERLLVWQVQQQQLLLPLLNLLPPGTTTGMYYWGHIFD